MDVDLKAKKIVVLHRTVILDGEEFDFDDLMDLLSEMESDNIRIFEPQATALKKIGVIKSAGGRDFPATKGPKFDEVYKLVMELDGSDRWVDLAKDAKIEE